MLRVFWFWLLSLIILDLFQLTIQYQGQQSLPCKEFWRTKNRKSYEECEKLTRNEMLDNLLLIDNAYCFNNGSGICKAINGRFEFLFNVFEDKVIGPVGPSEHVDNFGYHKRIPRAYNIKGEILYHDRFINWAKYFKKSLGNREINLLSSNEFNWCSYVKKDWWPYKSAIKDSPKDSKFEIYFFNRQSCIVNTATNDAQHYNTRFLQNSSNRIDLDMNPAIFAMEDNKAKGIRLVKHKRQHWYEVKYNVIEKPTQDIKYFVEMADTQTEPCIITGEDGRHILSRRAYRAFTNICISDERFVRTDKNSKLLTDGCGYNQIEIDDHPHFISIEGGKKLDYEVSLHNIPRHPRSVANFYGVNVTKDDDWRTFAKDGFVFSATTTIPIENQTNRVRVISLYAEFKKTGTVSKYDEHYPLPYFSDYTAIYKFVDLEKESDWILSDRKVKQKPVKNLNYVDDIAYLYKCKTILVIFGPLYSEYPADKFSLQSRAPIDSIYELGMWELTNAFLDLPEDDTFWAYHRLNYIASYKYTCAKGPGKLVTAVRSSKYALRYGANQPHPFWTYEADEYPIDTVDETFMSLVKVYKGNFDPREPPDPAKYPLPDDPIKDPPPGTNNTWLYILIGVGILLIIAMCIICLVTFKRRAKRGRHGGKLGSSVSPSARSGMSGHTGMSHKPTRRSSMASSHASSKKTGRSSLKSGLSKPNSRATSARTARSSLRNGSSRPSSRSNSQQSTRTRRSSLAKGASRPSSQSSNSKTPRSSTKSGSSAKGK